MRKLFAGTAMLLHVQFATAAEEVVAPLLPAPFSSHLHSAMIVSPAQIYSVQGMQTDMTTRLSQNQTTRTITAQGKWDFEWMSSILNLTAVRSLPVPGLNAGLNITSVLSEPDEIIKGEGIPELLRTTTQSAHTKYNEINALHIAPDAELSPQGYGLHSACGFNYQYAARDYALDNTFVATEALHAGSSSYSIMPAFTVTAADFEAGVAWQTAENGDDVEVPAIMTMHGRYAWDADLNLGAVYQLKRWSALKAGA